MSSPPEIESYILTVRAQRVILDSDLSTLYGVPTKALNQAIQRNGKRFPADFLFRLTQKEKEQVVTICDRLKLLKYSSSMPYAFTEYGAFMAANVRMDLLSSPNAFVGDLEYG